MPTIGLKSFMLDGHLFTLEGRVCNKPVCLCHSGKPHGPYWYIDHTKYLGRELPVELVNHLAGRDAKVKAAADVVHGRLLKRIRLLREQADELEEQSIAVQSACNGGYLDAGDREVLRDLKLDKLIPPSF